MLPRILRLPVGISRRTYSFFSSKPGGGRYFNSAKPHKVTPASATASTSKTKALPDDASPSTSSSSSSSAEDVPSQNISEPETPSAASQQPTSDFISADPRLPLHPTFSNHTYPLHHFFSLHRPLLLLPLATSTLFESPSTSLEEAMSPSPPDTTALPFDEPTESSVDADADAARQLARALAVNRVGGQIDWEQTLARLGDPESLRLWGNLPAVESMRPGVSMDSTRRKKRKKMSKHKYKKRRRAQRSERRKMGK